MKMTKARLQNIVICRPQISSSTTTKNTQQQHICLDKGYDYSKVYELLEEYEYTMHFAREEEKNTIMVTKRRREEE